MLERHRQLIRHQDTWTDGRVRPETRHAGHHKSGDGTDEGPLKDNKVALENIRSPVRVELIPYRAYTLEFAHGNKIPKVKTPKEVPAATAARPFVS